MKLIYVKSFKERSRIGFYFKALLFYTGLILIGVIASSSAWAVPSYRVVELGAGMIGLGGMNGINNHNEVVVDIEQIGFGASVISYQTAMSNSVNTLALPEVTPSSGNYFGNNLNDNGQVAGSAFTGPGTAGGLAAVFSGGTGLAVLPNNNGTYDILSIANNGVVTDLSTGKIVPSEQFYGGNDQFNGINNNSQAIGQVGNDAVIFNFNTNEVTDLGSGTGYAINNSGQAVGTFGFYDPSTGKTISLGGTGYEINASGQAVGTFGLYNSSTGQMTSLGGTGYGINDSGEVVGQTSSGSPFLYDQGTQYNLYDLLTPASKTLFSSLDPTSINNQGWIFGTGTSNNMPFFLAIPTTASVPLPSSLALLSLGLGVLGIIGRRQTRRDV